MLVFWSVITVLAWLLSLATKNGHFRLQLSRKNACHCHDLSLIRPFLLKYSMVSQLYWAHYYLYKTQINCVQGHTNYGHFFLLLARHAYRACLVSPIVLGCVSEDTTTTMVTIAPDVLGQYLRHKSEVNMQAWPAWDVLHYQPEKKLEKQFPSTYVVVNRHSAIKWVGNQACYRWIEHLSWFLNYQLLEGCYIILWNLQQAS